jgi:hypothetical protein
MSQSPAERVTERGFVIVPTTCVWGPRECIVENMKSQQPSGKTACRISPAADKIQKHSTVLANRELG